MNKLAKIRSILGYRVMYRVNTAPFNSEFKGFQGRAGAETHRPASHCLSPTPTSKNSAGRPKSLNNSQIFDKHHIPYY
ncbi:hypothetical protein M408DRAFT_329340 [Serendipita vermifera MAFF 305830]|uniref:Uncharacterized protein n=1 Tax=Serendipita vermifera MAFF 305830 TaxID=933852 RepID=A0A0C3AVJ0_SERVB|nr:hypothetical protein M408DRAFT_329340 [Serendipita vermifera MAFF 305830]